MVQRVEKDADGVVRGPRSVLESAKVLAESIGESYFVLRRRVPIRPASVDEDVGKVVMLR